MPMPEPSPETRRRPIHDLGPIRSVDSLALPVGQKVSIRSGSDEMIAAALLQAAGSEGFAPVESSLAGSAGVRSVTPSPRRKSLVAERNVRRVPTGPVMRTAAAVVLGAGAALGGLDAYIVGVPILAGPWIGAAGLAVLLLWIRYGQNYESEVIAAAILISPPGPPGRTGGGDPKGGKNVLWSAGRVRSVAFAGNRTAIAVVDCPVSLMEALVQVVRRFESDLL
jgi:hypothetical protein